MDRRAWPWRKKSSDKITTLLESSTGGDNGDQDQECMAELGPVAPEEMKQQWQQAEWKLKNAAAELAAKEELVKQHAKVAEEAVSGWEKAEAQTRLMKEELEAAVQEKAGMEDRVLHLDNALKECMRQLRQMRQEQGEESRAQKQRVHEGFTRKSREWEARLAEMGEELAQVRAEKEAAGVAYEAEGRALRGRLSMAEKECARWKCEASAAAAELEMRGTEREAARRAAEAAGRQHLENVKAIARLEAECQRLRLLANRRKNTSVVPPRGSTPPRRIRRNGSLASMSEDGTTHDDTDDARSYTDSHSWTLAPHAPVPGTIPASPRPRPRLATPSHPPSELALMDDFAEMERLASVALDPNPPPTPKQTNTELVEDDKHPPPVASKLKQFLDSILNADENGSGLQQVLKEVKANLRALQTDSNIETTQALSPGCHSTNSNPEEKAIVSSEKASASVGSELAAAIHRFLTLAESLSQSDSSDLTPPPNKPVLPSTGQENAHARDHLTRNLRGPEFDTSIRGLISLCQCLLQGKVDVIEFMAEVASALEWLVIHLFSSPPQCSLKTSARRRLDLTEISSPPSILNGSAVSGSSMRLTDNIGVDDGICNSNSGCYSLGRNNVDLHRKLQSEEEEQLESLLKVETSKADRLEQELIQAKSEQAEWERKYHLIEVEMESLKRELEAIELREAELQSKLKAVSRDKSLLEKELSHFRASKDAAESQLQHTKEELRHLEGKSNGLQSELREEREQARGLRAQLQELQQHMNQKEGRSGSQLRLRESNPTTSQTPVDDIVRLKKEQEIGAAAEKLAECQETILVLEKQLKSLRFTKGSPAESDDSISPFDKTVITTQRIQNLRQGSNQGNTGRPNEAQAGGGGGGSSLWPRSEREIERERDRVRERGKGEREREEKERERERERSRLPNCELIVDRDPSHSFHATSGELLTASLPSVLIRAGGPNSGSFGRKQGGGGGAYDDISNDVGASSPTSSTHSGSQYSVSSSQPRNNRNGPGGGRSPARFLNIKNRWSGSTPDPVGSSSSSKPEIKTGEPVPVPSGKHGRSFGRLFHRAKNGH